MTTHGKSASRDIRLDEDQRLKAIGLGFEALGSLETSDGEIAVGQRLLSGQEYPDSRDPEAIPGLAIERYRKALGELNLATRALRNAIDVMKDGARGR